MDYQLGFLGTYITAAEIGSKQPTITIERVAIEKVESLKNGQDDGDGKVKDRLVIYMRGKDRGWLVNRTNAECIKEMFGRDTDGWLGKRVTLYTTPVRVGPKMEPGIRVKGSPDIEKAITFEMRLPRKKPIRTTLHPTGKPADAAPAAEREPGEDG